MNGIGIDPIANAILLTKLLLLKLVFLCFKTLLNANEIILKKSSIRRKDIIIDLEINRIKIRVKLYEKNKLKFLS
jgi:hypothetical protein|tara:strand:- start:7813 stop:8037 length:225 start_codon:yes stop_codon:yes gene_type:complete